MNRTVGWLLLGLLLAAALGGGGPTSPAGAAHGPGWVEVVRLIDGDTTDVRTEGGAIERVRLFGYNTPELNERCFSDGIFALALHLNEFNDYPGWVYLEEGPRRIDQFGRSLYYAWVVYGGELYLLDEHMVSSGHATAWTADGQWRNGIMLAEQQARSAGRGCLWRATMPGGGATGAVGGNCHSSYPTVCIPPPPPDLDCGDIPHRRFQVVGSDPHRFDGEGDGIGCES
jgi:micrococcal nuclease